MTDPPVLNFRFGLDMERGLTPSPTLTPNFKFQIWPGHGNMTDTPNTLTQNFRFWIWSGQG